MITSRQVSLREKGIGKYFMSIRIFCSYEKTALKRRKEEKLILYFREVDL